VSTQFEQEEPEQLYTGIVIGLVNSCPLALIATCQSPTVRPAGVGQVNCVVDTAVAVVNCETDTEVHAHSTVPVGCTLISILNGCPVSDSWNSSGEYDKTAGNKKKKKKKNQIIKTPH
jgi:hypothetical protein